MVSSISLPVPQAHYFAPHAPIMATANSPEWLNPYLFVGFYGVETKFWKCHAPILGGYLAASIA
jgi:hypothetical protein